MQAAGQVEFSSNRGSCVPTSEAATEQGSAAERHIFKPDEEATVTVTDTHSAPDPTASIEVTVGRADLESPRSEPRPVRLQAVFVGSLALITAGALGVFLFLQPSPAGVLVASGDGTVIRFDPETGEEIFSVGSALASPDGSTVYAVEEDDDSAVVQQIDPVSGTVESAQPVPPRLAVRMVGLNGNAAVLTPIGQGKPGLYAPQSREVTDFTVVWKEGRSPKTFHLEGNFEPETFTLDGSVLYLLEFAPATNPDHYFVRQLDLDTGQVTDVYSPEVELNPEMRGHARAQAIHPDGTFMYTLYTVGSGEPLADGNGETRYAFVHVISLERDWSFCIFLPVPMGQVESGMGLTTDPSGDRLYVVDSVARMVAEIDAGEMTVRRSAAFEGILGDRTARTPIAVSTEPGRLFVANAGVVFAIDTETLQPTSGWALPTAGTETIRDIRVSADSSQLWVMAGRDVHVIDLSSMESIHTIRAPSTAIEVEFIGVDTSGGKFDELGNFICAC
jgi:DNA-binding beta-propeller fold protein YncE